MSVFKEKLYKGLANTLHEKGFEEPKLIQQKTIARINGGVDIIGVGSDGAGKSTTIVISVIQKLREAFEDAPRAFILVADQEKADALKNQFTVLAQHTDLRVRVAHEGGKVDKQAGLDKQGEEIYMGADVVIGTPKRSFDLYLKQHLNLNKLKLFVIDDAELMVKYSYQGQIDRMVNSLPKCQHIVFTNDYNEKVEKLISRFMVAPAIVEVEE